MRDVEPGNIWLRGSAGDAGQFPIGKICNTGDAAKTPSSGDLGVEVELCAGGQAKPEIKSCGERDIALNSVQEAIFTFIRGVEAAMVLADGGCLIKEIPPLGAHRL